MIRKLIAIFVEAFVFLSCTSLIAQEKQKPMTNADVVEMVQSGMTEEAIVGAIKAATPNFEITNDSTTALSKQQISERVILAMIRRQIEWDQSHPKIKAPVHRAPSNDTRPKWEVEFHGGISRTHHVGGWQHPPAAEAYSLAGSGASGYWGKRVSSWYFGDGAELIGLSSSLDSTLVGLKPAIQPQKNQMFGFRASRALTKWIAAEFTLDRGSEWAITSVPESHHHFFGCKPYKYVRHGLDYQCNGCSRRVGRISSKAFGAGSGSVFHSERPDNFGIKNFLRLRRSASDSCYIRLVLALLAWKSTRYPNMRTDSFIEISCA